MKTLNTYEVNMEIERLAGIPGKPEVVPAHGGWRVVQCVLEDDYGAQLHGPICKTEGLAFRAWNTMVRRIREANAQ